MNYFSVILLVLASFSAAVGQILFKIGARDRTELLEYFNIPILFGMILYGVSTIIWIYMLSKESLVNVYVFTALTFVLVYLGGIFLLKEQMSLPGIFGIIFVLFGLYLIINYNN